MKKDIARNFEFLYFGNSRHLCPNLNILDKPFEVLKKLGGIETLTINQSGTDKVDEVFDRGFGFEVNIFEFPGHSIEAYCVREERPKYSGKPKYITRIRLGKYNFEDTFSKELSESLAALPASNE